MRRFEELLEEASERLRVADHLLTVTYPLVKDPKLLMEVVKGLQDCLVKCINSLIEKDLFYKFIDPLPEAFPQRFMVFREVAKRHGFKEEHFSLVRDVEELVERHKQAPLEFSKKGEFVICSDNFQVKKLSVEDLKKQVLKAKEFLSLAERAVKEDVRVFGRG